MATFVLVHGGGHGGWCWQPVARRLRAAGHEVHAPTLTGLGERRHLLTAETGLETHIEDVAQQLFHEDLREVVLVGHSYGGMVITGAADRCPERIARLVYLDAAIPANGERLVDSSPGLAAFDDSRVVDGVRLGLWPEAVIGPLYGLTDAALAAWALPRLAPHPWKTFEDRLALRRPEAVAAIPRAIVNCTSTLHRRPAEMLPRWSDAPFVRELDTGHDLMLTEPDRVAALLGEIATSL
jgi:pimeloyl-ACP methyl ester carboxylesterase